MLLILYVDDLLLAGTNLEIIKATKKWLFSIFEMKDMGEARYVLGLEIIRNPLKKLLGISQETYIKKVLERFRTYFSKPADIPIKRV